MQRLGATAGWLRRNEASQSWNVELVKTLLENGAGQVVNRDGQEINDLERALEICTDEKVREVLQQHMTKKNNL